MYKRHAHKILIKRILEPRRFIQVLAGPRQTGKTTIAQQAADDCGFRHTRTADPVHPNSSFA